MFHREGKRIKIYLRTTKSVLAISFVVYNKLSFNKNCHREVLKEPWRSSYNLMQKPSF